MGKPYPSERQERFIVRLPDGMRDQIAEAAKSNNRTMNAEVVSRLQKSFDAENNGKVSVLRTSLNPSQAVGKDALAEVVNALDQREASLEKRITEQLEKGFTPLAGQIDRLEKRFERLERGLLTPPPMPKGPLWPPPKVKSQKD
jgi:hypothetical protein